MNSNRYLATGRLLPVSGDAGRLTPCRVAPYRRARTRGGMMALRVVLADDHIVLRQGVRALLERHGVEVVAEASDGRAAVELAREHEPDVAVLDIMMPLLNGIDAARQIVEARPGIQVVMLTALEQERLVTEAVRAGVRGFVLKTQAGEDLAQAIQQVSRGGFYVGAGVSQAVVDAQVLGTGTIGGISRVIAAGVNRPPGLLPGGS